MYTSPNLIPVVTAISTARYTECFSSLLRTVYNCFSLVEGITGESIPNNSNDNWCSLDGKTGIITANDGLNVREGKSSNSKILGVLKHGEKVRLYRKEGDWIHIYYGAHGGYVYGDYINIL